MERQLRRGWAAVVAVGFVFAILSSVFLFFSFADSGRLYVAIIKVLMFFHRLGLPTLISSIEGWPFPSVIGWVTIVIMLWGFYTTILTLVWSLRFGVRRTI
jgi:hypothetical protein